MRALAVAGLHATTPHDPVEGAEPHPPLGGSGTGSLLLHYFSTNRVDSRGLRWIPVDSTAADKRLTSNVLDHKLRVVSQLSKHGRTGSTPCPPGVRHSSVAAAGRCVRCTSGRTTSAAVGRTFTCQSIGVSARFSSVIGEHQQRRIRYTSFRPVPSAFYRSCCCWRRR